MRLGSTLGFLLLAAGLAVGFVFGRQALHFELASPGKRLEMIWSNDLNTLFKGGRLPPGWSDIREIQLTPATEEAKAWVKDLQVPIPVKAQGSHKLEILLISWEEEGATGAIVMHHLLDAKTNNTIWELSRTYTLDEKATKPSRSPLAPTEN